MPNGTRNDSETKRQVAPAQEGAASHGNSGARIAGRLGLHAVDVFFQKPLGIGERRGDQSPSS